MANNIKTDLSKYYLNLESPAADGESITPHDTTELENYPRAVYVGVGGDLVVDMALDGSTVTLKNVPAGTLLPLIIRRVRLTGTTATNIVGLW